MDHHDRDDSGVAFGLAEILFFFTTLGMLFCATWYIGGSIQIRFIGPALVTAEEYHEWNINDFWLSQQLQAAKAFMMVGVLWCYSFYSVIAKHYQAVDDKKRRHLATVMAEEAATTLPPPQPAPVNRASKKSRRPHRTSRRGHPKAA